MKLLQIQARLYDTHVMHITSLYARNSVQSLKKLHGVY